MTTQRLKNEANQHASPAFQAVEDFIEVLIMAYLESSVIEDKDVELLWSVNTY